MKRIKKMVPLGQVAEKMASHRLSSSEKELGVQIRARQILGPNISNRVEALQLKGTTLIMYVKDPSWLKHLEQTKHQLITHLQQSLPQIKFLAVKTWSPK